MDLGKRSRLRVEARRQRIREHGMVGLVALRSGSRLRAAQPHLRWGGGAPPPGSVVALRHGSRLRAAQPYLRWGGGARRLNQRSRCDHSARAERAEREACGGRGCVSPVRCAAERGAAPRSARSTTNGWNAGRNLLKLHRSGIVVATVTPKAQSPIVAASSGRCRSYGALMFTVPLLQRCRPSGTRARPAARPRNRICRNECRMRWLAHGFPPNEETGLGCDDADWDGRGVLGKGSACCESRSYSIHGSSHGV